jgi:hypothetical protein
MTSSGCHELLYFSVAFLWTPGGGGPDLVASSMPSSELWLPSVVEDEFGVI